MRSMETDDMENPNQKIEIEPILMMLTFLMPQVRAIDQLSEYFLRMCRMSLLEAEQKKGERAGRH